MTDPQTKDIATLDNGQLAPVATPITTSDVSQDIDPATRIYEITTGGTGGIELLNVVSPTTDGGYNPALIGARITFYLKTQTDGDDVVHITLNSTDQISFVFIAGLDGPAANYMELAYEGAAVSFLWCHDRWSIDPSATDGDFNDQYATGAAVRVYADQDSSGKGIDVIISPGPGAVNKNGGKVYLRGGASSGTGVPGYAVYQGAPTEDPHEPGALWNNLGILTISSG